MVDSPVSDTGRAIQHDPDQSWPDTVKVQLMWMVNGHSAVRTVVIDADQFFGRGRHGAPMDGSALIGAIENMRREGPPPFERRYLAAKKKR